MDDFEVVSDFFYRRSAAFKMRFLWFSCCSGHQCSFLVDLQSFLVCLFLLNFLSYLHFLSLVGFHDIGVDSCGGLQVSVVQVSADWCVSGGGRGLDYTSWYRHSVALVNGRRVSGLKK